MPYRSRSLRTQADPCAASHVELNMKAVALPLSLLLISATYLGSATARADEAPVPPTVRTKPQPASQPFAQPPGQLNQRCLRMHTFGRAVYSEMTRDFRRRPRRFPPPATGIAPRRRPAPWSRHLTIWQNGAWQITVGGQRRAGCLARHEVMRLQRLLANAQFRADPRITVTCAAVATGSTTITAGRRNYTFTHPCGRPLDPSLARARRLAHRLVNYRP